MCIVFKLKMPYQSTINLLLRFLLPLLLLHVAFQSSTACMQFTMSVVADETLKMHGNFSNNGSFTLDRSGQKQASHLTEITTIAGRL